MHMAVSNHPTISTRVALRPTHILVDLDKLTQNYKAIQHAVGDTMVMPILKAKAYGHGWGGGAAASMGVRARVHLKIDTGMERIGVHYYSAESLLEASLKCKHVEIEGIFSHFANADAIDLDTQR